MISVIIPSYRNPKCLDICLHSALENQRGDNELIVIIDGFIEESQDVLKKYEGKIRLIDLETNYGMQHALNMGVYNATSELIFIINDDNVLPKDWDIILEQFHEEKNVVTPNQIERGPGIFNFIVKDYGGVDTFDFDRYTKEEPRFREMPDKTYMKTGEIFPFFMRKKYYMAVGGFDTIYDSPFICDWDFFLKLELIGMQFFRTKALSLYHFGSIATKNGNEKDRFIQSERDAITTFEYKWGFQPIRNDDNSHSPKGHTIKGITYE